MKPPSPATSIVGRPPATAAPIAIGHPSPIAPKLTVLISPSGQPAGIDRHASLTKRPRSVTTLRWAGMALPSRISVWRMSTVPGASGRDRSNT